LGNADNVSENFDARVNISRSMAPLPFLVGRALDAILKVTVDRVLISATIKIISVDHVKLQNRPDCKMLVVSLPKPQILAAHLNQTAFFKATKTSIER
jgi:hypothetical protein